MVSGIRPVLRAVSSTRPARPWRRPQTSGGEAMCLVTRSYMAVTAVATALFLLAPAPALAQGSPTGTLAGTVSDPSGGVLPGVAVTAKNEQTGLSQTTVSGGQGDWRIPA